MYAYHCDLACMLFSYITLKLQNPFTSTVMLLHLLRYAGLSSLCLDKRYYFTSSLSSRTYYEEWAFILDEERASMLPTMAAGEFLF